MSKLTAEKVLKKHWMLNKDNSPFDEMFQGEKSAIIAAMEEYDSQTPTEESAYKLLFDNHYHPSEDNPLETVVSYSIAQQAVKIAAASKPHAEVADNQKQSLSREQVREDKKKLVCYCGSLRVALDAFKKSEYESIFKGEIALLPCCMFVDIQREYGENSEYKVLADELHKRKIDICDEVFVLNVNGYIGESTRGEIEYAKKIGKPLNYLEPLHP